MIESVRIGVSAGLTLLYFGGFGNRLRQHAAGGVDRGLHVLRGDVDVAIESELKRDRR